MDQLTVQKLVQAGKIAAQVRRETAEMLRQPGVSFLTVLDRAERRILELGGQVAWAQYAVNDVAAHACPEEDDTSVTKEGDMVKVDIGVHLEGWLADNAMTIVVGKATPEQSKLLQASQNALKAAIALVRPGVELWELGQAQMAAAEAFGFTTIKNLCGHSIDRYKVHAGISIPTYNTREKKTLVAGQLIAIEPFVTTGQGFVKDKGKATVFMVEKTGNARSAYARQILEYVQPRNGLPFSLRELTRKLGKGAAALGLRELLQLGIVRAYPPLAEVSGHLVAQFEHTMIIGEKTLVITRHPEDTW